MTADCTRVKLIFYFLFVIGPYNIAETKVYVYRFNTKDLQNDFVDYQNAARDLKPPLNNLLIQLKTQDKLIENTRNTCVRLFGSIHGTRDDRIRCLENLKKKRVEREKLKASIMGKNYRPPKENNDEFVDYTRGAEFQDKHREQFSTDYIDFDDLRTGSPHQDPRLNLNNYRKYHNRFRISNSRPIQRAAYSSTEEDDINDSFDEKTSRYSKKPKRFQVIKNAGESSESTSSESTSSEDTKETLNVGKLAKQIKKISSSAKFSSEDSKEDDLQIVKVIKETAKKPRLAVLPASGTQKILHKKMVMTKDSSDSESSSEEDDSPKYSLDLKQLRKEPAKKDLSESQSSEVELKPKYVEPIKAREFKQKDMYLQGNHIVDLDGRKRLATFLPKRFHWDESDIHSLGYYWFDGNQGRVPHFPERP